MNELFRVLIIYANAGAGHRRAAEALYEEAKRQYADAEITLIDALDYTTPFFRQSYPWTYLVMVRYVPLLWGWGFYFLEHNIMSKLSKAVLKLINFIYCRGLANFLMSYQPDLVLTTHFLPNEIISQLKKTKKFKTFLITCITDYYPHILWKDTGVDFYVTPSPDTSACLVKRGIIPEKIEALGIPIATVFGEKKASIVARRELGLIPDDFTVLVTSGGFGVGPVMRLVMELLKISKPLQILAISGSNPALQADLQNIAAQSAGRLRVYGFVRNMHQLMDASDIMVSKSGGLTTTEAMSKGLPLIILRPIPGQEEENCRFLLKHQAGRRAKSPEEAARIITTLMDQPDKLADLKANMAKLGRSKAAMEIVEFAKKEKNRKGKNDGSSCGTCAIK